RSAGGGGGDTEVEGVARRGRDVDGVVKPLARGRAEEGGATGVVRGLDVGRSGGVVIGDAFAAGIEAFQLDRTGRALRLVGRGQGRNRVRSQQDPVLQWLDDEAAG